MSSIHDLSTKLVEKINKIAKKSGFSTWEIQSQLLSKDGNNYLGQIYQVDVKGRTDNKDSELNLFVKIKTGNDYTKWISASQVYRTEMFAYKELAAVFKELEIDANVPPHERFKMVKYYGGTDEAIILENVAKKGFKTYNRMNALPLDVAEMAIKELAKLHALSFALEEKRPEYFQDKIKIMKYPFIFEDEWLGWVRNMIKLTLRYVDEGVRDKVEKVYNELADKYKDFFEDDGTKRCLCHADFKTSNIMVRTENGKVTDIVPVDYQFLHYGCPVLDFLFFIFISTDKQFRDAHLSNLKDLYHDSMKKFLEYFNMDVDLVYPRAMFDDVYKDKVVYGLLMGFVTLPLILVPEDDVPELGEEMSEIYLAISDTYKARHREMIKEFEEWGYIK